MKAVVLAYGNIGCTGIEALLRNGFEIAAVFTHKDDPNENIWFGSVAELAASHGIPVFAPDDINHPLWIHRIQEMRPDILFSFYYRSLVKQAILDIPPKGCLNLHGSLLPAYRGRCPINWVLVNGESKTGITLHYMTAKADAGDIVAQEEIEIESEDDARTLHQKSQQRAAVLLDRILPQLATGKAPRIPQDASKATIFGGRKPADGQIDWSANARTVRNLVRAVARPFPGAFSFTGNRACFFWKVSEVNDIDTDAPPGTVLSLNPFVIACGKGAIRVESGQQESGVVLSGAQLANELNLTENMRFGASVAQQRAATQRKSVLILGVNGFIGNALGRRLLSSGKYEVHGMDLNATNISELLKERDFYFHEGDVGIHREWIEYHVKKCDIVLPLVAIATPIEYVRNPLRVFELDFEENIRVVRYCAKYGKRVIFPSTSEVYGMCEEPEFNEETSKLVLGPINKQRWIYSSIKQLLDRVIWAYGQRDNLPFTLFRPFNWIGPRLDSLMAARTGSSRAITQLILNLVEGTPIQLVDGGAQKRCFVDVDDAIEALYRIIENKGNLCNGRIINIGNPDNEASIKELAEILVKKFDAHPLRDRFPKFAGIREIESQAYYGTGYEDMQHRRPSIANARRLLEWQPRIGLEQSVETTLDFFLRDYLASQATPPK